MEYNQNDLVNAMSDKQLEAFKKQYAGNEKVTVYIEAILAGRTKEAEEAKVKDAFEAKVLELVNLPKPPETIHNIYMAWRETDDTTKPEEVEVAGVKSIRYPKIWKWVTEVNHATDKVSKGEGSATTSAGKRAITVYKRNGTSLMAIGNFHTGSSACDHLKLDYAGTSAVRVLRDGGYIVETYTGTSFTDK